MMYLSVLHFINLIYYTLQKSLHFYAFWIYFVQIEIFLILTTFCLVLILLRLIFFLHIPSVWM